MINKVFIIFSGFNQRAVIAFLRTLTEDKQSFGIIAKSDSDQIFLTQYKDYVYSIRKKSDLNLFDIQNCIDDIKKKIRAKEYIIAPSTEALNRFILNYALELNKIGCTVPLVNGKLYELISDKYSFSEICKKKGIKVPENYETIHSCKIPFVAKPVKYFSKEGTVLSPFLILNIADKKNFIKRFDLSDFYFQKYIYGKSYYLLYYFHRNGKVFKFSQQNIVQQPDGKSIIGAIPANIHQNGVSQKYEAFFKEMKFHGFVMIELKFMDGEYFMIEANPRFWGPSQLFVDAGMNFFKAFINDYVNSPESYCFPEKYNNSKYFWFGGMINVLQQSKSLVFHEDTENLFYLNLSNWLKSDIYNKLDSLGIFKAELTHS